MKIFYIHHKKISKITANNIQVINMCWAFSELGHKVDLWVPEESEVNDLKTVISNQYNIPIKFEIKQFKNTNIFKKSAFISTTISLLLERNKFNIKQYDVLYTRHILTYLLLLKYMKNIIFESHNDIFHSNKIVNRYLTQLLLKSLRYNFTNGIVCISRELGNYWQKKGVKRDEIIVKHDGMNPENYRDISDSPSGKEILGFNEKCRIATYVGSLQHNRGIDNIIQLAIDFPNVEFVIIGDYLTNKENYEKMAIQKEVLNISFLGSILPKSVPMYLAASDVLIMNWTKKVPTINFCSPLKVFEYMACGRVIVGPGFPTIKEVCNNEEDVLLFEPDNYESMKKIFKKAIEYDYPNKLSSNARKKAFEKYGWDSRAKNILDSVYLENEN
jgi:glycosyltransferase involved in cell wall biosynthesis